MHAVEIDRRLEAALRRTLDGLDNVTVHWGDAMRMALDDLEPRPRHSSPTCRTTSPPRCCSTRSAAAGRAALVRASSSARSPTGSRRRPETPLYGAPSVLCALALEQTGRHAVSRSVFVPVPNVDSTLVAFVRRPEWDELAGDWPRIVATVRSAFAYRRKTVANALALAGWRADRRRSTRPAAASASIRARAPRRCRPTRSCAWRGRTA